MLLAGLTVFASAQNHGKSNDHGNRDTSHSSRADNSHDSNRNAGPQRGPSRDNSNARHQDRPTFQYRDSHQGNRSGSPSFNRDRQPSFDRTPPSGQRGFPLRNDSYRQDSYRQDSRRSGSSGPFERIKNGDPIGQDSYRIDRSGNWNGGHNYRDYSNSNASQTGRDRAPQRDRYVETPSHPVQRGDQNKGQDSRRQDSYRIDRPGSSSAGRNYRDYGNLGASQGGRDRAPQRDHYADRPSHPIQRGDQGRGSDRAPQRGRDHDYALERVGIRSSNFAAKHGLVRTPPAPIRRLPDFGRHGFDRDWDRDRDRFEHGGSGFSLSLILGDFRIGYCQYDSGFRESWFRYPRYCYTPYYQECVPSPWYYYPMLPPYVPCDSIFYTDDWRGRHGISVYYDWRPVRQTYDVDPRNLDYAINDLVRGFENRDFRMARYLVPTDGSVDIFMDHDYKYSLRADDFSDMLRDAVDGVRTVDYRILDVHTYDDGTVQVEARHESEDPWGRRSTVYHTYRLEREDSGYVIREFGTSADRE